MKVAIGIPCREQGRFSTFHECLHRLKRPEGTEIYFRYNNSVAQARNHIVKAGLADGCDTFFFLDDDMLFQPDVLMRLLARPESMVLGLTMMRCQQDGIYPPIWSEKRLKAEVPGMPKGTGHWLWEPVSQIVTGANGMMPLVSGTGGGVLIRRAVFDSVRYPWWDMGQYNPEMFYEDISLYEKAADAGFQLWGDPSVRFGHYDPVVIWPHCDAAGAWSTVIAHGFEGFLVHPWPVPELV